MMETFGLMVVGVKIMLTPMEVTSSQADTAVIGITFGATCNTPPYSNIDVAGLQWLATLFFSMLFLNFSLPLQKIYPL